MPPAVTHMGNATLPHLEASVVTLLTAISVLKWFVSPTVVQ